MNVPPPAVLPAVLRGDGLVLRAWRDSDAEYLPELFDDPQVDRWTPLESPFGPDAAARYLVRAAQGQASARSMQLAVTRTGDRPLGEILVFPRGPGVAEVGYVIGPAHRGHGLATRAVGLVVGYARDDPRLTRLVLRIGPGNVASERVALACGFTQAGFTHEHLTQKGRSVELATWERSVLG